MDPTIDPAFLRGLTQRRLSRRDLIRYAGVGAGALSLSSILAACGVKSSGAAGSESPAGFDWIYEELGDVWLFSTSGGTDVCTPFVGGTPLLPVRRGELQAVHLGVDLQAFDVAVIMRGRQLDRGFDALEVNPHQLLIGEPARANRCLDFRDGLFYRIEAGGVNHRARRKRQSGEMFQN